jgi:hypothetical protein
MFAAWGISVKVIRPEKEEAPLVAPRPARVAPGMPAAVIRLAIFAVALAALGITLLMLRG